MHTPQRWRQIQRENFTDWRKLLAYLQLESVEDRVIQRSSFSLNLPIRLAQKVAKGTIDDPILRQFLPMQEENHQDPRFSIDPVQDNAFRKAPKLLHKYPGRALLVTTSACAMHCRYCFRKNFEYETGTRSFEDELTQISADPTLSEIILSGGDPLSLSDAELGSLIAHLESIPHLRRLRFHTRFPIGIPERLDESFLKLLSACKLQVIFVIHCNHPKELDADIFQALAQVQRLGIPVLCQTVLLQGVNDCETILKELFETLSNHGILPYYLHQLDPVQGSMHFEVDVEKGKRLIQSLRDQLSGYAVPHFVAEIPFQNSKTVLN